MEVYIAYYFVMNRKLILLIVTLLLWNTAVAGLTLGLPFGDHAVLQHGKNLPVWGVADAGVEVKVTLGTNTLLTKAGADGKWQVEFPASKPSKEGISLEVTAGDEKLVRNELLFGDVWIATGQSNMRWMLKQCATGKDAIAKSDDKLLRLFHFDGTLHPGSKKYSKEFLLKMTPENYYATQGWQPSNPTSSASFSGVAYFFAQKLRQELDIPIGVIQLAVGGTPIEAHMPRSAFENDEELKPLLQKWWVNPNYPKWCRGRAALNLTNWTKDPPKGIDPPHPFAPTFLWDAGIKRIAPFPVKGVIWYQGESNAGKDGSPEAIIDGALNKKKFKLLIEGWRDVWGDKNLPVYYAQLPGLNRQWPVFREMQLEVSREMENVGMAVTIDHGHPTNVHPAAKLPVGNRLARLALSGTYGKDLMPNGPMLEKYKEKDGKMYLSFENGKGLKASDGGVVRGFEIAGEDKKFYPAEVKISVNYLELSSPDVRSPAAVRYAWANDPGCNLINAAGLPASPFRTDRWKNVAPSGHADKKKSAVVVPKKKDNGKIRVACIGDSITFGAGIKKGMSYPAQLQKLLGDQYEVKNFGNSGRGVVKKSMRGKSKRAFIFMKEHQDALDFEPHIVICNLGINDLMDWDKFGKDDFVGDYSDLLQSYKTLGTYPRVIIWHKLSPLFEGQKFFRDKRVDAINKAIAIAAKNEKVEMIDMEKPLIQHSEWFVDRIHPNAEGAKKIAEVTAEMINKK